MNPRPGLTYVLRFGTAAGAYQSRGAHAYFPTLATGLGAALAAVLLGSLAVVAAARCLARAPAGTRCRGTARYLDILAAAFAVQLALYAGQECVEALAAGGAVPSAGDLLLWGALGQLPAAAIAATVIGWLLTRLEAAWTTLVEGTPRLLVDPAPPEIDAPRRSPADARARLGSAFPPAFRRRGPPGAVPA